jgi:enoyl-CoA hydratase
MSDRHETIAVTRDGPVTTLRLARPPVNPVNRQMMDEITAFCATVAEDRDIRAIVLAAAGDQAFCAGIDLKEIRADRAGEAVGERLVDVVDSGKRWRDTKDALKHVPVPVVAAVEGPAIGAGLGLAGVADVIIASRRARFGLTEINVGALGGAAMAMRMVGPYKARMMFFSGELVSAEEMHRLGVVEEVTEPGAAEARAREIAALFATKSPLAMRLAKESMLRVEHLSEADGYRVEQDYTFRLRQTNDSTEALTAYLEGRDPDWTWS